MFINQLQKIVFLMALIVFLPAAITPPAVSVVEENVVSEPAEPIQPGLTVDAAPISLAMGDTAAVEITVTNGFDRAQKEVTVQMPYHPDILYHTLGADRRAIIGELAGRGAQTIIVPISLTGLPPADLSLPLQVRSAETRTVAATFQLSIVPPEQQSVALSRSQTTLSLDGERMSWESIEAEGGDADFHFVLQEQHALEVDEQGVVLAFALQADGESKKEDLPSGKITINLNGLIPDAASLNRLQIAFDPDLGDESALIPLEIDHKSNSVIFASQGFGSYRLSTEPEPWSLVYTPPGGSEFSGAAQYSYGLALPPGIGGLAPQLSLSYSSRGVDQMRSPAMARGFGAGWSLPQPEITNGNADKMFDPDLSSFETCPNFDPQLLTLQLDGTSYRLVPETAGQRHGRYYAVGDPSFHIEFIADTGAPNLTGEYWRVRTAGGTEYTFGYEADAEQVVAPLKVDCYGTSSVGNTTQPRNPAFAAAAWKLDTVEDSYQHKVRYLYQSQCRTNFDPGDCRTYDTQVSGPHVSEVDVAVREIQYNFAGSTPQTVVSFRNKGRNRSIKHYASMMTMGIFQPAQIEVRHNGQMVKGWEFIYEVESHDIATDPNHQVTEFWWLTSIAAYGLDYRYDPVKKKAEGTHLPVQRFIYEEVNSHTCGWNQYFSPREWVCVPYLTEVHNGYGAVTKITYEEYSSGGHGYEAFHVTDIETWDGVDRIFGQHAAKTWTQYDRSGATACYDNSSTPTCDSPYTDESDALVGFDQGKVIVRAPNLTGNANPVVSRQTITFHTDDFWLNGKMKSTVVFDPVVAARKLSEQVNHWSSPVNWFTKLNWTASYTYDPNGGSSVLGSCQSYIYDVAHQGGQQWGRPTQTAVYRYLSGTAACGNSGWQLEKQTQTRYLANTSTWVIVPWMTGLYGPSLSSDPVQLTLNYYDGSDPTAVAVEDQSITQGELTLSRQLMVNDPDYPGLLSVSYPTVDTAFGFDSHGNLTSTSTYDGYGFERRDLATPYSWRYSSAAGGGSNERVTTTTYTADGWLVDRVQNDLGHQTRFAYTNLNLPWQPTEMTDVNGRMTTYSYDLFGRLENLFAPGAGGVPSVSYVYYDTPYDVNQGWLTNGNPLLVGVWTKTDPQATGAWREGGTWSRQFYNGLGQLIQTQTPAENWAWSPPPGGSHGEDIISYTDFDALGRQTITAVPYAVAAHSSSSHPYRTPDPNAAKTVTTYDGAGRVSAVTAPSGDRTTHHYGVFPDFIYEDVIDANRHRMQFRKNVWGQLTDVFEFTGDCNDQWTGYQGYNCAPPHNTSWDVYAQTTYAYDLMGNLERVTDDAGYQMQMTHDALGRKLSMNDPDMGQWTYEYSPTGSLTRQTDANGTALCFFYDDLDRLVSKINDSTPSSACPGPVLPGSTHHLASFVYDTQDIGQLAQTSWGPNPGANYETFSYDNLGRLDVHTRWIDGRDYDMTTHEFDALGRPLEVEYPDGEWVTVTYDHAGADTLQVGNNLLVSGLNHNAQGQITELQRGSGVHTAYNYLPASGNFRLEQIVHGTTTDALPDFAYQYDPVGNVTRIDSGVQTGAPTQTFAYDHLNRLILAEELLSSGAPDYRHQYEYDQLGNINKIIRTQQTTSTIYRYSYDSDQPHAVDAISYGSQSFIYDNNGNMTGRHDLTGSYTQNFDVENRLVSVVKAGVGTTTFAYDAAGSRVKTVRPDGVIIYSPFPEYEEEVWPISSNPPAATLTVNGQSSVNLPPNTDFTLQWHSPAAVRCAADGGWSGEKTRSDSEVIPGFGGGTRQYTLTCRNSAGVTTRSVTVNILPLPAVNLTANYQGNLELLPNTPFTLRWSSTNAASCWANGSWSGSKPRNGSQVIGGFGHGSRTYSLHCSNTSGTTSRSVTVSIMPEIQSYGEFVIGNTLFQGFWRNDLGWRRKVPIVNGVPKYNQADPWEGPISISVLPGSGELQSQSDFVVGDTLYQGIWRGDQGWSRTVPIDNGEPNWGGASGWSGPLSLSDLQGTGSGSVQAQADYVLGNKVYKAVWRNHLGYVRWVPITGQGPDWGNPSEWSDPITYGGAGLLGQGAIQTQGASVIGSNLYQGVWRGHFGWSQTVPIVGGSVNWGDASPWSGPVPYSTLPGGNSGQGAMAPLANSGEAGLAAAENGESALAGEEMTAQGARIENGLVGTQNNLTIRRSTYVLGRQTIATQVTNDPEAAHNGLFYTYSDHLGSASAMSDAGGNRVGNVVRYYPFGDYRSEPAGRQAAVSDRGFTGHLAGENHGAGDIGLIYMNARYYIPGVGRFASADTVVPDPANPQSWNRYSYVHNNPMNYTDPSGHWLESAWDAISLGMGVNSFRNNVREGNVGAAVLDGVGIVVDAAALALPVIPGGVSAAIRGARGVDAAVDVVQAVAQTDEIVDVVRYADEAVDATEGIVKYGDEVVGEVTNVTPVDLYAFGRGPQGNNPTIYEPRINVDIFPNAEGMLAPQYPPLPHGKSTFADPILSELNGHYYRLPSGTELPNGMSVMADGPNTFPNSPHPPTHHTIYNYIPMHQDDFTRGIMDLPWEYVSRIKK